MFLLNSCLGLFSAACLRRRPFSRSYGAILPSSLTMLLPPALGSSPHPPVSVYGTGMHCAIAAFLDRHGARLPYFCSVRIAPSGCMAGLPAIPLPCLPRSFHTRVRCPACVPTVLAMHGTGISTCCPSATPHGLALGPDSPRADQLYPGNLGYSAWGIPTPISLLIPAFSLPSPPRLLSVPLRRAGDAPLPPACAGPQLRRRVLAPDIFGAGPLD